MYSCGGRAATRGFAEGPIRPRVMTLSTLIKLALLAWLLAELAAFALVAHLIGIGGALLLGCLASVGGLLLLKRTGTAAMLRLKAQVSQRWRGPPGAALDDTLATAGALALVLPGFLSDAIGLGLCVPAVRRGAAGWITARTASFARGQRTEGGTGRGRRVQPASIDLDPADWRGTDATDGPTHET